MQQYAVFGISLQISDRENENKKMDKDLTCKHQSKMKVK